MGRMFGTDGVRGIANKELTAETAYNLGRAGAFVFSKSTHKPKILVGMDTRISGDMLENALVAGILSVGAEAICLGIVPTPAVAYLTKKHGADAGVVISASHNPVEYNGIKFFNGKGYKLSDELEDKIQSIIESGFQGVPLPTGADIGRKVVEDGAALDYVNHSKTLIKGDLKGLKVALDCANGAAYITSLQTFRELGAEVVVINNDPDGVNINKNCGSTHPQELMDYVVKKGCDLGLAFDGDADRCLAVDETGKLINGDFIMGICGRYLKEKGKLKKNVIVGTVMSNLGLHLALEKEGIKLVSAKVGDRYVLEEMIKEGYVLGGEQSGHIIYLKQNTTGDGLATGLMIANIIKSTGKKLSELASFIKELPQVLVNARIPNDKKNIYLEDKEIMDEINRIEDNLKGRGRVLIRPSGTEPLVRVMLEGEDQKELDKLAHSLAELIEKKANA
jgi:phosphoglucosamine mutase